jgi:glycosyltransferase involved in cell wall biosynthesis
MKILLVAPEYPPYGSGIANVVYMLCSYLSKKGVDVDVLSRGGADINITSPFNAPGLFHLVPFWQKAVDYILKKSDYYDAIWLHSPLLINVKKLSHIQKIMISFHTTYYGHYRACKTYGISHLLPYYYFATKLEYYFLKQLSYYENMTITAISPSVAEELRRNGLVHFIHIVPNGLEIEHSTLPDKFHARELLCKKYSLQLSKKDIVLLYIGRITELKQPLLLIDFFKGISIIKPNIHLVIAGSGNLFAKMRRKAIYYPNIHMLGNIPHKEIWTLLRATDAFISLSCYEGLPLAVLEAASFGLPLILSDIPAHRFIINSKVGYGILIDLHKPSFIEICRFLDNIEKKKLITNVSLMKQFTWEDIVKQYLILLNF